MLGLNSNLNLNSNSLSGVRNRKAKEIGKKKERKVKAPTGGPYLSGARRAHGREALGLRERAAGPKCAGSGEVGRARCEQAGGRPSAGP